MRCHLFLQGLPYNIMKKLVEGSSLGQDDVPNYRYDELYAMARKELALLERTKTFYQTLNPVQAKQREDHLNIALEKVILPNLLEYSFLKPPINKHLHKEVKPNLSY